jgi:hypothetical protein
VPVETSAKSSKTSRNEPETGDLNAPKPRRFFPQPVETTATSSRKRREPETGDLSQPQPRRFAPQPVETSSKSSKDRKSQHARTRRDIVEIVSWKFNGRGGQAKAQESVRSPADRNDTEQQQRQTATRSTTH